MIRQAQPPCPSAQAPASAPTTSPPPDRLWRDGRSLSALQSTLKNTLRQCEHALEIQDAADCPVIELSAGAVADTMTTEQRVHPRVPGGFYGDWRRASMPGALAAGYGIVGNLSVAGVFWKRVIHFRLARGFGSNWTCRWPVGRG